LEQPQSEMAPKRVRVALMAVEMGRIRRGFERFFRDLFNHLGDKPELDVTLYKGGGMPAPRERLLPLFKPIRLIAHPLSLKGLAVGGADYSDYRRECLAFALSLIPELLTHRYDLFHVIDPPLVFMLQTLQRLFNFPGAILFTEGTLMPPPHYPGRAHIHHVAQEAYQEALSMGIPEARMTLIPPGLDTERFKVTASREELRKKYGISESTFVILAISAVRRIHKRVHHIINEASQLKGDYLLWIDGNLEDPMVPEIARNKMGEKCRITYGSSEAVPELHRIADVMAHGALQESFGAAVMEGMSNGVPVLIHDSPHFEWVAESRECLVDMRVPGRLAERLSAIQIRREEFAARARERAERVRQRFDWRNLAPEYLAMYLRAAGTDECRAVRP
jgi:glycosyltransferase involved in cell wall biosynthesis